MDDPVTKKPSSGTANLGGVKTSVPATDEPASTPMADDTTVVADVTSAPIQSSPSGMTEDVTTTPATPIQVKTAPVTEEPVAAEGMTTGVTEETTVPTTSPTESPAEPTVTAEETEESGKPGGSPTGGLGGTI